MHGGNPAPEVRGLTLDLSKLAMLPDKKDNMPFVSVIMPAYNAGSYIALAIESILAQTMQDFELIICDDGSTDDTVAICRNYKDDRIRIYRNEQNEGVLKTFNKLLGLATGSYVALQDADDMSAQTRLERQLQVFSEHPEIGVVFTNGFFFLADGRKLSGPPHADRRLSLENEHTGIPASIMLRSDIIEEFTGWNLYFDRLTSMDRYFIMEILSKYPGYLIGDLLYFARMVPGSSHRTLSDNPRKLIIHDVYLFLWRQRMATSSDFLKERDFAALEALEQRYLKDKKKRAVSLLDYAISSIEARQFKTYLKIAAKVFEKNPFHMKQYRALLYCLRTMLSKKKKDMKAIYTGMDVIFEPS